MKTKIILLLLAFEVMHQFACKVKVNDPCGPFPTMFDVQSYSVFFVRPQFLALPLDTSVVYPYDSIAIRLEPLVQYLYTQDSGGGTSSPFFSSVVIACSPPIPYSIDTVSTIWVVTDFNYDSTFSAGDTINNILTMHFLDDHRNAGQMSLDQFMSLHPSAKRDAFLCLNVPPSNEETVRLIVYIKHRNGEEFTLKTRSMTIRP